MKKKITTAGAPAAIGPYSQGISIDRLIFASGQIPLDPATGEFPPGDFQTLVRRSLQNLKNVLEAGGASLDTVVKTTCFLTDMNDFAAFNEIYLEFFTGDTPPARSCIAAAGLPKGAPVEVEAVAYMK